MCLPKQNTTHRGLMLSRQAMINRRLPQRMVAITFALALLCAGLCVLPGYAGNRDFPLADFAASYRITEALYGADLELSLVRSENGHVMTRKLAPSGLFSLVLPSEMKVGSMQWLDARIVPLNYVAKVGKDIREELFFDWEKSRVSVVYRGRQDEFPVSIGTLDEMAMQAQIMADMKGGGAGPWNYQVVSRGKLKDHRYEVVGEEEIDTVLGRLRTLILVRHKEGKADYRFWTSPKHDYLPVRGEKIVNGEVKYEMYLKKLSGPLAER